MDKELAKKLIPLVNNKQSMQLLGDYIDARIELLRVGLEVSKDPTLFFGYQGQIKELKQLKQLKDEVLVRAKEN